jgi:integrase
MLLPAINRVKRVQHYPTLPYTEIGAFMTNLQGQGGVAARALEFAILTAARTGEVIGATWDEIDLQTATWTIPAVRMKGNREHRIPLSEPAMEILEAIGEEHRQEGFIFPGARSGRPLSNMALLAVLKRMARTHLTVHGFRSTFKDWATECTAYTNEVSEIALAHAVGDKVEAAYRRGDLFEKRRRMMADWAAFCGAPISTGKVVTLAGAKMF